MKTTYLHVNKWPGIPAFSRHPCFWNKIGIMLRCPCNLCSFSLKHVFWLFLHGSVCSPIATCLTTIWKESTVTEKYKGSHKWHLYSHRVQLTTVDILFYLLWSKEQTLQPATRPSSLNDESLLISHPSERLSEEHRCRAVTWHTSPVLPGSRLKSSGKAVDSWVRSHSCLQRTTAPLSLRPSQHLTPVISVIFSQLHWRRVAVCYCLGLYLISTDAKYAFCVSWGICSFPMGIAFANPSSVAVFIFVSGRTCLRICSCEIM